MPTIIDALVVTLGLDASGYNKGQKEVGTGLDKLKESAGSTAKEMEARGKQAAAFVTSIKNELIGLFAVVTAGKGLSGFISDSVNGTAALGRLATNLNMSARDLDGWGTAAEAFGGTAEGVQGSMQHIAGSIQEFAATGNTAMMPFFRSMGIELADSHGKARDYRDIMLDISDKLKGMDPQQALFFGHSLGLDDGTINLLRQGREEVTKLVAQMTQSSGVTQGSVEAAQRAQLAWAIFHQELRGIGQTIFAEMAPALQIGVDWLMKLTNWMTEHHDAVVGFFAAAAAGAAALALATIEIWGPIALVALAIAGLSAAVGYCWQEWQKWTSGSKSDLGGLFQFVTDVFNGIKAIFAGTLEPMKAGLADFLKVYTDVFKLIGAIFGGTSDDMRKAWKSLIGDLGAYFQDWVKVIETLAPRISAAIIKAVSGAWDYIKKRYSKIANLFSGDHDGETPDAPDTPDAAAPGADAAPNTGPPQPAGDAEGAVKKLMGMGWTKEQAAGIAGNLQQESTFNPNAVGDGGQAYGIAQWHKDRQAEFKKWAGKDIKGSSFDEQLGFVNYELRQGNEKAAGDKLAKAESAADAGAIVSKHYERPGNTDDVRAKEAANRGMLAQAISSMKTNFAPSPLQPGYNPTAGVRLGADARAPNTVASNSSTDVQIQRIEINTQATDASGIARDLGSEIKRRGLTSPAATGDS